MNDTTASADLETLTLLSDSAEDFCSRQLPVARLRALRGDSTPFDRSLWQAMCELGWGGIAAPEAVGGLELGARALGAICRRLGQVVAPEPMLECGAASAWLLAQSDKRRDLAEAVVSGTALIGAVLTEAAEHPGAVTPLPEATPDAEGYRLRGTVRHIPLAPALDGWLIPVSASGETLLVYLPRDAADAILDAVSLADGSNAGALSLAGTPVSPDSVVLRGSAAEQALAFARQLATLASSAYLLGIAERALSITTDYLKTRQQFGRAIGAFQALQHRAVDLYIQVRVATAVVEETLAAFDTTADLHQRNILVSRAKYRANEAALMVTRQAVQLHGGIGYTDECDVGLYLNRALVLANRHGTSSYHSRTLAGLLRGHEGTDKADTAALPAAPANGHWDDISDEDFRRIVRQFFESEYPAAMRNPSARFRWQEIKPWYLTLSRKGWVAPAWPAEHGGMGLSPAKLLIYIEEQERWGIGRAPDMGIQMVGPLLIRHGTEEQRERYLPPILSGEAVWCQGYSEPNAGSDLASLRTEAVADGDEFVINGQKTWTTLAQDATHMFCLARTSREGKQQEGISFFLIDLDQPGITIRPIRNIAGHEEFCEVFLDNVRVPADCLVGGINQGWTIAKALLGFERIFIGSPKQSQYCLMRAEELAAATGLNEDSALSERLTRLKLDVLDLESTYQCFADIVRRGETLGPDVSLLKIWGTETFARLSELMVEMAGIEGTTLGKLHFGDSAIDVMSQFYNARPATIYGGTNEIQRNIIAKNVLALPG